MKLIAAAWLFLTATSLYAKDIRIAALSKNVYVYTTYHTYQDMLIATNGTYLVTGEGVILIDTPWDTSDFQPLLDTIEHRHRQKVVLCMATHFHADRTAGLEYYTSKGIPTYTTFLTDSLSKLHGEKRAAHHFRGDTTFIVGGQVIRTYYPGKGHAPDNIVVWYPEEKILHGGCFVKSAEATDLGNLSDANVKEWEGAIEKVIAKFKDVRQVIAGHQDWRGSQVLLHTRELIRANNTNR